MSDTMTGATGRGGVAPTRLAPRPGAALIETRGLTKRFGGVAAVDGLDLRVPAGGVYGFLGPNGSGKSTTMKLLLGLLRPDAGEVGSAGRRPRVGRCRWGRSGR